MTASLSYRIDESDDFGAADDLEDFEILPDDVTPDELLEGFVSLSAVDRKTFLVRLVALVREQRATRGVCEVRR